MLAVKAVIMTNESGQPENASYAQAKHAYERRNVLDQLRERQDRLERGAKIRAALEKACSATVLELLSGRNAADLADLGKPRFATSKAEKAQR